MIRMLRIELRRSATPWVLPLLAVLLGITPLIRDLMPVGLWLDRSVDLAGSVQLVGPFGAGTAAWMASRGSRRRLDDLLASTPRSPWSRTAATWLGSMAWITAFYIGLCVVFLSVSATQATWGAPIWWPIVIGLVSTVMCSAVGFAIGLWFPSRFTTPLVAVGVLAAILGIRASAPNDQALGIGLLSPIFPTFGLDASVFYRPLPDVAVMQLLAFGGVLAVAVGAMAGRGWRRIAVALVVVGVGLVGTAGWMDSLARHVGPGIGVFSTAEPAVAYTPVCSRTDFPVCVHPAYAGGQELAVLSGIIDPIVRPVLGVPGMPVRAEQGLTGGVQGDALMFTNFIVHGDALQPAGFDRYFRSEMALSLFLGPNTPPRAGTAAQRALALYLIQQAHDTPDPLLTPGQPEVTAAAARFTHLSPGARNDWLTHNLAAVRAGSLTPEEVP